MSLLKRIKWLLKYAESEMDFVEKQWDVFKITSQGLVKLSSMQLSPLQRPPYYILVPVVEAKEWKPGDTPEMGELKKVFIIDSNYKKRIVVYG